MAVAVSQTGERIVIEDAKLDAYLARGFMTDEQHQAMVLERLKEMERKAMENPATLPHRFLTLRIKRDGLLAQTDYLVAADYPVAEETLLKVKAYRQALRDLPQKEGAPWDGGGELTPWPEKTF